MRTLALVSCGKTKLDYDAPAKDLYTGDLFKKARSYVTATHDGWEILSAKHHMVEPDTELSPYNETLIGKKKDENYRWSNHVFHQIINEYSVKTDIYIYAGMEYRKNLVPMLIDYGYKVHEPLKGLGIGQQKAWYKQRTV